MYNKVPKRLLTLPTCKMVDKQELILPTCQGARQRIIWTENYQTTNCKVQNESQNMCDSLGKISRDRL